MGAPIFSGTPRSDAAQRKVEITVRRMTVSL